MTSAKSVEVTFVQDDRLFGLRSFDDFVEVEIIKNNIYEDDYCVKMSGKDVNEKEIPKIPHQPKVKRMSIWQKFKKDFMKLREANFPCELCNERCLTSMSLERHWLLVHATNNYSFIWKAGYQEGLQRDKLLARKNEISAKEGVKFICNECGFKASQQEKLWRHKRSFHVDINIPMIDVKTKHLHRWALPRGVGMSG